MRRSAETATPRATTSLLLYIGDDPSLLAARTSILAGRWNVQTTLSKHAWATFLDNDFDLAVICHSVPAAARDWLVKRISAESPSIPILIASPDAQLVPNPPAIVLPHDPELWITIIESLLTRSRLAVKSLTS